MRFLPQRVQTIRNVDYHQLVRAAGPLTWRPTAQIVELRAGWQRAAEAASVGGRSAHCHPAAQPALQVRRGLSPPDSRA